MQRTDPLPGLDALHTPALTLNGATKQANFMFVGGDALAAGTWADRSANGYDLTLLGNGGGAAAMTYQQGGVFAKTALDPIPIPGTGSVARWESAGAITPITATDDFVFEFIFRTHTSAVANYQTWASYHSATVKDGWWIWQQAATATISLYLTVTGGAPANYARINVPEDAYIHVIFAMNRDGATTDSYPIMMNGAPATGGAASLLPTTYVGQDFTPAADANLSLMGCSDGYRTDRCIRGPRTLIYAAQWLGVDWLADGAACKAEIQNLARERFSALTAGRMSFNVIT